MKSTNNPNDVTFSAGSAVYIGPYGTSVQELALIGLLAADMSLNVEQTVRQKMDRFPEVVVAESIQAQSARAELTVREWNDENLKLAFGLTADDVTTHPGGDQNVTQAATFRDDLIVLENPIKPGEAVTLTTPDGVTIYTAGADYVTVPRDLQGRTLVYRLAAGAIPAGADVQASYTYTERGRTVHPIGRRATVVYRTVRIVEELTSGGKTEVVMWRARVGVRGAFAMNAAENSGDIPLVAQALYDPAHDELASLINYAA